MTTPRRSIREQTRRRKPTPRRRTPAEVASEKAKAKRLAKEAEAEEARIAQQIRLVEERERAIEERRQLDLEIQRAEMLKFARSGVTPEQLDQLRRGETVFVRESLTPEQIERRANLELFLQEYTDEAGLVDVGAAILDEVTSKAELRSIGFDLAEIEASRKVAVQRRRQERILERLEPYQDSEGQYDLAAALRDKVVNTAELSDWGGFDPQVVRQASRGATALDALDRQGLVREEAGERVLDLEAIVRARAEGLAVELGVDPNALEETRREINEGRIDVLSKRDAIVARVAAEPDRVQSQTTERGQLQTDTGKQASLTILEEEGFATIVGDTATINITGAMEAGLEDELIAAGFTVKQLQDAQAEHKQNQITAALGAVSQFEKDRALFEAALEAEEPEEVGISDELAVAMVRARGKGHLDENGVNVIGVALDPDIPTQDKGLLGVNAPQVAAATEFESRRLLTPEGDINAVLAYGLAQNNQEGLTVEQVDGWLRALNVSAQDMRSAKALAAGGIPDDIDAPGFAVPVRTFPPSEVRLARSADFEPAFITDTGERVLVDDGPRVVGQSPFVVPLGVPVGRVGLGIAAAAALAALATAKREQRADLPTTAREQVSREQVSPPGIPITQPIPDVAATRPDIPVSPPVGLAPANIPELQPVEVPEVTRTLNAAAEVIDASNVTIGGVNQDSGLTNAEKAALTAVANRITSGDQVSAVSIDQAIDQALAGATSAVRSGWQRRLAELRAKQQAFDDAAAALVVSQGFSPQNITPDTIQAAAAGATLKATALSLGSTTSIAPSTQPANAVARQTVPVTVPQERTQTQQQTTLRNLTRTAGSTRTLEQDLTRTRTAELSRPAVSTLTLPITGTATETLTQPQTLTRTGTRTLVQPLTALSASTPTTIPPLTLNIPRVITTPTATTIPQGPQAPEFEAVDKIADGIANAFDRIATWQQGVTQVTQDWDTGRRTYEYDPEERFLTPRQTHEVLVKDDTPTPRNRHRMGFMDVIHTPDGPKFTPNQLAAQNRPRTPRKGIRGRGLNR